MVERYTAMLNLVPIRGDKVMDEMTATTNDVHGWFNEYFLEKLQQQ